VCPLSNVRLRTVDALAGHPLPAMLDAGLLCTVNSDDPAYFGGYVDDNYAAVATQFALSAADLARLAAHSVEASFLPPDRKAALGQDIDTWLRVQGA
jgi:adenosine deaminase